MPNEPRDERVAKLKLWAWVGEDELGSGEVGLKQALVPAGMIPLVACKQGKMTQPMVADQMRQQAGRYGKTIRLVRFTFEAVEIVFDPNE